MPEQVSDALDQVARVALVAHALTAAPDASTIVDIVVRQGMAGLQAEGGVLAFLDDDGTALVPAEAVGYTADAIASFAPMTVDLELPLTRAAREHETVWVGSMAEAQARFPALVAKSQSGSQAWAAIPLAIDDDVLGVLGVSFLEPREFSEAERLFIGALADVSALALARHRHDHGQRTTEGLVSPEHVVKRLYASSLALSSVLGFGRVDDAVAERLYGVIDELDAAVREVRRGTQRRVEQQTVRDVAQPANRTDSRRAPSPARSRCLYRFDDGEVFAYARGLEFFRVSDHQCWARETGDVLRSARSGAPLARRGGSTFVDVDSGAPLYYEGATQD